MHLVLLTLTLAVAAPLDAHWSPLPALPVRGATSRQLLPWGVDGALLVSDKSELHVWDGASWEPLARLPEETGRLEFHPSPDGRVAVARRQPAGVRWLEDGRWGPWETVGGLREFVSFSIDRTGVVWAGTSGGTVVRQEHGRWTAPTSPVTDYIRPLVGDGAGGAWLSTGNSPLLAHLRGDGSVRTVRRPSPLSPGLWVDDAGALWTLDDTHLVELVGDTFERRLEYAGGGDRIWAGLRGSGGVPWVFTEDTLHTLVGGAPATLPLPAPECAVIVDAAEAWHGEERESAVEGGDDRTTLGWSPGSGAVYALCPDGAFRLAEGASLPLQARAPADLGLPAAAHALIAADLDGDGRDDLALATEGAVETWLQREDGFVAGPAHPGPAAELSGACDLDGDGRDDLIVQLGEVPSTRFTVLLSHPGWLEPRPLHPTDLLGGGWAEQGHATCTDLDGDGDPDLILTGGHSTHNSGLAVAVYLNRGRGELDRVALPVGGLGDGTWTRGLVPGDLDGDGDLDLVSLTMWSRSVRVFERTATGFVDRTATAGMVGSYSEPVAAVLADLDGGGGLELLALDEVTGPRAWRAEVDERAGLRMREVTGALGLAGLEDRPSRAGAFGDLDGDGDLDIALCGLRTPCAAALWDGERFVAHRSAALGEGEWSELELVDLGGDGDLDWVGLIGPGIRVLENRGDAHTPPRALPPVRTDPLLRRLAGLRSVDLLAAIGLLCGLALVGWRGRARGWTVIGLPLPLGLLGVALLAVWLLLLDRPPGWRALLPGVVLGAAFATVGAEGALHRWRSARRIAGYRLGVKLGAGGMGTVYLAIEPGTGRAVALKVVRPELFGGEADRARFRREAEIGAGLDDPRLVRLYAWGECTITEGGQPRATAWLAMELLTGSTLRDLLRQTGPLPVGEACAIGRELCLGLAAVHEAGVVHRDVKPENVFVERSGAIRLMDFGAARGVGQRSRSARQVLGTLGYLAPEQGRGQAPAPSADLYAVGVVLYELLTGGRPFRTSDLLTLLAEVLESEPPPLTEARPAVPAELAALVHQALAKDPADRPADARAIAAVLELYATTGPLALPVAGPPPLATVGLSGRLSQLARLSPPPPPEDPTWWDTQEEVDE
ncbi:MAG: hypothetical protein ACI9K2_003580 [Myxococcota bacterium]|jgi:hypothetical protein